MEITVETKAFCPIFSLTKSVAMTGATTTYTLEAKKEHLWLYAHSDLVTFKCKAKGVSDVSGSEIVGVDVNILEMLLKGRAKLSMELDNNTLKFKGVDTKYSGQLVTLPVTEDTINSYNAQFTSAAGKKIKGTKIDNATFKSVCQALDLVNINAVHSSDPLDTYIHLKDGVLEAAASDNFHVAFYTAEVETDAEFQLSTSKSTFDALSKLGDAYPGTSELVFGSDAIKAVHKSYSICMPTIQSSDESFVKVKGYIENLPKATTSFKLNISSLSSVLANIMGVYEEGSVITFNKKKGDKLELSITTAHGSISDIIDITDVKGTTFKSTFDPRMIQDVLNRAKGDVATVSYIDQKSLILSVYNVDNKSNATYIITVVNY